MDINRRTAYNTLLDIETKKQYSNIALNNHIAFSKPSSPGFVRELVYGVLENKYLLDYVIDQLIPKDVSKMKKEDLTILRMGIYQIDRMNSVPDYAAVNESVLLAKRYAKGRDKFVNGVLRSFLSKRGTFDLTDEDKAKDIIKYLSVKYSYEPWIIKLWLEEYNINFVEELLSAGNETPSVNIRVNTTKVRKEDLINILKDRGFEVEQGKFTDTALSVKGEGLLETKQYIDGMFSIQDEASQMVVKLLDPKPGDLVIDVCAAPGGKALAAAEKMDNKGKVLARDVYRRKVEVISSNAERLGLTNVVTNTWDATKLDSTKCDMADKVIVDAPCSGLGVIRRKPEIKYIKDNGALKELPKKQLLILTNAAAYVKKDGVLVYSTCTINPNENRKVVGEFLRKNTSFKMIESRQVLPNIEGVDGFYMCKMVRV
ncbi:MAG: 16S rRNA (cytosine(967)-C(5))-methyltransferase RsmB [Anaerovoracaceae bacterium]